MSHGKRPEMRRGDVGIVTIKIAAGLPSLRYHAENDAIYAALSRARRSCRVGEDFRVLEYSVQSNHLHLIVEAESCADLQTGMRGLMAHLGNALRRLWKKSGRVFADRYHLELITTPTRMRHAYRYVLNNARKHNSWTANKPDPYSSGPWFRGWSDSLLLTDRPRLPSPCSPPRSWLAQKGWLRAGPRLAFADNPVKPPRRKTLLRKT
ncbi:MAG: hypothetical protein AAF368_14670 [Planctomycetota bacterium]